MMKMRDQNRRALSRRQAIEAAAIAAFAAAAGTASTSVPAHAQVSAQDSMKALLTPIPPQVPMTEGIAELGDARLWFWDTGGAGEAVVLLPRIPAAARSIPISSRCSPRPDIA
jgi:hypothetical protein